MKKLTNHFRALLAIVMMLSLSMALPTFAHNFEVDGIYYNIIDDTAKTVEVTYKGSSLNSYSNEYTGRVTIPSSVTYNGVTYSVASIGSSAFSNCSGLTSITIGNSVTSIGYSAFYNCSGLTSITIGNSVTSIGYWAFSKCSGLTLVTIPNSVTSIGHSAFSGCSGLTSVTIPNSVTSIGDKAFSGCIGMTSVTIGNSVTSIGDKAFSGCIGMTSVTIGNSVTSIGDKAFEDCSGLTSINISDLSAWCKIDFYSNSSNPLYYANKLKLNGAEIKDLVIPNDITKINSHAFSGCSGLTSVTIPNSVTSIGSFAFYGCSGLTLVTIPNSVTSIGQSAFSGCSGLTSVTIPNSVTSIGGYAFYSCYGLTEVNYYAENCTSMGSSSFPVFDNCSNIKIINFGDSVKNIPSYAFNSCYGLTEVNISDLSAWCKINFSDYDSNPLYYAKKLNLNGAEIKDLVIPNDITEIKNYAFSGCSGLTSVTIGNSVTSIGSSAFEDCSGLTSVTIGNSVTSIGSSAFEDCSGLTSVTIPNSVTTIGGYAFSGCDGLASVTIGNSVTSIGNSAFKFCSYLKTIVSLNPIPPTCGGSDSFYNYANTTLYVPKDSFAKYFIDDVWGKFNNIKKIETLVSSITLNETTLSLNSGSDYTLNATASPSNATIPNLTWESDNNSVAIVDQNGKVTGVSAGTATITVRANDGSNVSATCKVTVNSVTTTITLSQTEATLPVNDIMTLSYSITNSATKTATWSTSDANVAYVKPNSDGSATVVGMAVGVATITATVIDNGKEYSASCVVTVGVGGIEGVEADNNAVEVARYDIHGRLITEPTKGVNIIKYSDGTTRKEIVK